MQMALSSTAKAALKASKNREAETPEQATAKAETINLGALLSQKTPFSTFRLWIVGDTPLITHAWSHKAKEEMLQKQVKATKPGKQARDPDQDFVDSLYDMGKGRYGFPATGVKNCILSAA